MALNLSFAMTPSLMINNIRVTTTNNETIRNWVLHYYILIVFVFRNNIFTQYISIKQDSFHKMSYCTGIFSKKNILWFLKWKEKLLLLWKIGDVTISIGLYWFLRLIGILSMNLGLLNDAYWLFSALHSSIVWICSKQISLYYPRLIGS